MKGKNLYIIIFINLIIISIEGDRDCIKSAGKTGKDCHSKSTFLTTPEWDFVVEDDLNYLCCYYSGKLGEEDYEGCFAFEEDEIKDNKINDLLNSMEKGLWEKAINVTMFDPKVDCYSKIIKNNIKYGRFFILLFILLFVF